MKRTISCVLAALLIITLFSATACTSAKKVINDFLTAQAQTAIDVVDQFLDGTTTGEEAASKLNIMATILQQGGSEGDLGKILERNSLLQLDYNFFISKVLLLNTKINEINLAETMKDTGLSDNDEQDSYIAELMKSLLESRNDLAGDYGLPVRESTP